MEDFKLGKIKGQINKTWSKMEFAEMAPIAKNTKNLISFG